VRRTILLLAFIVVVVAVGVAVVNPFHPSQKPPTATVTRGSIEVTVELSGTVEAERARTVSFATPGVVAEVSVHKGQEVKAGDLLAKLDASTLDLQVKAAQAALTSARSRYAADRDETTKNLPSAVRTATLDADRAAIATAQASLAQAREALRNAVISAPISGTVTEVGLEVGQHVTGAASPAGLAASGLSGTIEIQDLNSLRVSAEASEIDLPKLSLGQGSVVTLDALEDARLEASVCEIGQVGKQVEGVTNYEIIVCLRTPEPRLRAGMTATADVVVARREGVLLVPTEAIRLVEGKPIATVLGHDGRTSEVAVQTGLSSGGQTEIVSGLTEGQTVVLPAPS
jgi:RND family efflux transporter MFP subunit